MDKYILDTISRMNDEESRIVLQAVIKRREEILDGGEVVYAEYSREAVKKRDSLMEQVDRIWEEEKKMCGF